MSTPKENEALQAFTIAGSILVPVLIVITVTVVIVCIKRKSKVYGTKQRSEM